MRQAGPAEILDQRERPGAQDLECVVMTLTPSLYRPELDPHPGSQQRGWVAVDVPQLGGVLAMRPMSCQPPGDSRG